VGRPFYLRAVDVAPTMDTLLVDDVGAPLDPTDSPNIGAFARRGSSSKYWSYGTNLRCCNVPGLGSWGSRESGKVEPKHAAHTLCHGPQEIGEDKRRDCRPSTAV
jgi:hypothetical protein